MQWRQSLTTDPQALRLPLNSHLRPTRPLPTSPTTSSLSVVLGSQSVVWGQHWYPLGTCQGGRFLGSTPDLLNQKL